MNDLSLFHSFACKYYNLGRMTGLEPANGGITTRCLNHLATPAIYFTLVSYHAVVILVYNFLIAPMSI